MVAFAVLFASLVGVVAIVARSDGYLDARGHPIGTDFANVYAAGTYVMRRPLRGAVRSRPARCPATGNLRRRGAVLGWHYPPFFLFVAAPRWRAHYGSRCGVVATPADLSARSARPPRAAPAEIPSRRDPAVAPAFPAVLVNAGHGQNGASRAALIGGALVVLDRRPAVAGILFGLLSYKPQFGLMIPLVLIATQRWRAFGFAAVTSRRSRPSAPSRSGQRVERVPRLDRIQPRHRSRSRRHRLAQDPERVLMGPHVGRPVAVAYAVHAAVVVVLGVMLVRLWRSDRPYPLKAGALIIASVLSTPYALDYDMMALAPAIAFLAVDGLQRGFSAWQKTALAVLWLVPIVARSVAEYALLPIGVSGR